MEKNKKIVEEILECEQELKEYEKQIGQSHITIEDEKKHQAKIRGWYDETQARRTNLIRERKQIEDNELPF